MALLLRLAVLVASGTVLAGGCGDTSLDDVRWACASDRECGSGAHCRLGVCAPRDVPELAAGLVCEPSVGEVVNAPRFSVEVDEGLRTLVFAAGDREARFALPPEVVSLDQGPLEGCCANPCCALIAP